MNGICCELYDDDHLKVGHVFDAKQLFTSKYDQQSVFFSSYEQLDVANVHHSCCHEILMPNETYYFYGVLLVVDFRNLHIDYNSFNDDPYFERGVQRRAF